MLKNGSSPAVACRIGLIWASFVFVSSAQQLVAGPTTIPSGQPFVPAAIAPEVTGSHIFQLDSDDDEQPASAPSPGRYFFNLLDNRSSYGHDFFPDAFIGPDFDSEKQIEIDYSHGEKRNVQEDELDFEFQWQVFGEWTIAGDFGWSSEHDGTVGSDGDDNMTTRGFSSVDLAVYHPLFQYVSPNNFFDYSAVGRIDVGIPTRTPVSGDDLQLTPYFGQLIRLGKHVSLESWVGPQLTIAPHSSSQDSLIYGGLVSYEILRDQLAVPLLDNVAPAFELDGQRPFSPGQGQDALFGVAELNAEFKDMGDVQPVIGIGYQFPIDQGGRDQIDWGIILEIRCQF